MLPIVNLPAFFDTSGHRLIVRNSLISGVLIIPETMVRLLHMDALILAELGDQLACSVISGLMLIPQTFCFVPSVSGSLT
jgi:hypothetical protein